ncbi:MAG: ComF family protein [Pseudomonadota bacterium]
MRTGDAVYPPACLGCGAPCQRHGALCGTCWSSLQPIERPYCDVLGTPFSYNVGEAIVSPDAMADPPPFERARAAVVFDGVARRLVHGLKYKDRLDLADTMARWMVRAGDDIIGEADVVVPVPLHRRRLFMRQSNQSAELARALAGYCGLPYLPTVLTRKRATRQQVGLGARARADNVRGAFHVPSGQRQLVRERSVLLVDDVYTTGATVKSASRTLLRAGATSVGVLTFARVAPDRG